VLLLGFQTQPTQQPEPRITHGFVSALQHNDHTHNTPQNNIPQQKMPIFKPTILPPTTPQRTELLLLVLGFHTQLTQQPEPRITHGFLYALQHNDQKHNTPQKQTCD
jgi:hypothetical protein